MRSGKISILHVETENNDAVRKEYVDRSLYNIDYNLSPFLLQSYGVYLCDCSLGNVVLNLKSCVNFNREVIIKKIDATLNTITIIPYGIETIDLKTNLIICFKNTSITIIPSNNGWNII